MATDSSFSGLVFTTKQRGNEARNESFRTLRAFVSLWLRLYVKERPGRRSLGEGGSVGHALRGYTPGHFTTGTPPALQKNRTWYFTDDLIVLVANVTMTYFAIAGTNQLRRL